MDASISTIDDIATFLFPVKYLASVRESLANLVMLLSVPYIFTLFFYKTKRPLAYWSLPIYNITFMIIASFSVYELIQSTSLFTLLAMSMSPHWIYSKHPSYFYIHFACSIIQLIVGIICFRSIWSHKEEVQRKESRLLLGGFVSFSFAGIYVVVNVAFIIAIFVSASAGFIGFNGDQITSIEKVYEKNGKTIHLIPMIHVGAKEFYEELSDIEATKKTLILLEGVSDEKNLLTKISYSKMAKSAGLDEQAEHFKPQAKTKELQKNISYIVSDVDASKFTPETREFINKTMKTMSDKSFLESMFASSSDFNVPGDAANLSADLIEKRNHEVIKTLAKNESKFERIYIPWGAMHLPEIEREVKKLGYKMTLKRERPVISILAAFEKK